MKNLLLSTWISKNFIIQAIKKVSKTYLKNQTRLLFSSQLNLELGILRKL